MADNMIELIAQLDTVKSEAQIKNDLVIIANMLNSLENNGLNIQCHINTNSESVNKLQNELSTLASQLKLNVGVNAQSLIDNKTQTANTVTTTVKVNSQDVQSQITELSNTIRQQLGDKTSVVLEDLVSELKNTLGESSTVWSNWIRNANNQLTRFSVSVKNTKGELTQFNYEMNQKGEPTFLGSTGNDRGIIQHQEQLLKFIDTYTSKLNSLKAKVGESFSPNISAIVNKATITFDSFEKKLRELSQGKGNIEELRTEFVALEGTVKNAGSLLRGSDSSLNPFTNAINNFRTFDNDLKALEVDYNNLNAKQKESETLIQSLANAQKKLTDLQTTQKTEGYTEKWIAQYRAASIALTQFTADLKLAKKLEQQDSSSFVHKQTDALIELRDAYKKITSLSQKLYQPNITGEYKTEIERQITAQDEIINKTIQRAEKEGLINQEFKRQIQYYAKIQNDELVLMQAKQKTAEAQKLSNEELANNIETYNKGLRIIKDAYKKIADATKIAYSNNSTDIKKSYALTDIAEQRDLLNTIQERLVKQGLIDDAIKNEIKNGETLVTRAQQITQVETQRVQAIRDERETERHVIEQAREHGRIIEENINILEKFNKSSIIGKNTNNPAIVSQLNINENLIVKLRALQESLANDKSSENVNRIKLEIDELNGSLQTATQNSITLEQSLKSSDTSAKLKAKLNTLTNQIEVFANTNKKATHSLKQMRSGMTFAEEWQRIISTLRSGNLDANGIQRLTEDFRNFKGQASAAGITTSKFFTDMGNQIKMVVSRWVSLYAIIGRVTSALNDLKSLDKTLTEIAKSSDVTRESLESLGNTAFDKASKYGRAANDYLYAVQEFSRAGFRDEQLEGLAEVSLLAQSAGDIETDLANSYVIATNAAYGYEGSIEKLNDVLD